MAGRELMQQMTERWNAHDEQGWSGLFAEGATVAGPGGLRGSDAAIVSTFFHLWQDAFPDNQVRVVRMVAEGDQGVLEAVFEGTHTETLHAPGGDIEPTGRRVAVPFVNVCAFTGDRYGDFVLYFDQMELLAQLGLVGAPTG
jgi:predicted ester cyclase